VKPPKKAVPERRGTAFWITRGGGAEVWLVTRPVEGMLGGMRALPDDGWSAQADGSGKPPLAGAWRSLGAVRHGFTHASLTLEVIALEAPTQPQGEGQWWPVDRLDEAGLATLFAKATSLALA
jgi:A/G-specific adenine glycosylase